MGRQTTDNIHGTPWQQAAVAIITPLRAEAVEPRGRLTCIFGEALLAGETGGCPVGYTPWLVISEERSSASQSPKLLGCMLCSRQRCQGQPGKARTVCDQLLGPGWLARRHQFRPGRGRLAIEAGRVRLIRRKHKTDQTRLMYCAGVATSYRLPVPLLM